MKPEERSALWERYVDAPARLRTALERVPKDALQWRPAPDKWSIHEVVAHCADSETVAATRIRYVVCEDQPVIQGYDQDRWARASNYHSMPLELALRQVEQVHAWTAEFLRALPDSALERVATHTESGAYSAEKWLRIYAKHIDDHVVQIERTLAQWNQRAARSV
ncbi:MAG: DinB family protein [Planctomycetes bacterium]|nr:DinB family protein [Planctomycetota bacterium]